MISILFQRKWNLLCGLGFVSMTSDSCQSNRKVTLNAILKVNFPQIFRLALRKVRPAIKFHSLNLIQRMGKDMIERCELEDGLPA